MPSLRFVVTLASSLAVCPTLAQGEGSPIQDNSFLIEEAYNQEPGVIQHVSTFNPSVRDGTWAFSFTEEWPVLGQTHQASVTLNYSDLAPGVRGFGDLSLNYRWQALGNGETAVALAPRVTLLIPTGNAARGLGNGGMGVQVNLPLSVVLAEHLVTHVNAGATYVPSALAASGTYSSLLGFAVGQSMVWLAHQHLNFVIEALYTRNEIAARAGLERTETLAINPGLRGSIDFASGLQIVPGVSVPIGLGPSRGDTSLFFYLSFEHPFALAGRAER